MKGQLRAKCNQHAHKVAYEHFRYQDNRNTFQLFEHFMCNLFIFLHKLTVLLLFTFVMQSH